VFLVPPDLAGLVRALHDDCLRSASEKARQSSTQDPHCQSRKGNTRRPWGGEGDTMRRSGGDGEPSLRVESVSRRRRLRVRGAPEGKLPVATFADHPRLIPRRSSHFTDLA
jgi:hypothetical protein